MNNYLSLPNKKISKLPIIKSSSILLRNNDSSLNNINNISETTNCSAFKSNSLTNNNNSLRIHRKHRFLKKVKLNPNSNAKSQIFNNKSIMTVKKEARDIIENADNILKERLRYNDNSIRNLLRKVAINKSKEISLKNNAIKLLKEKRVQLSEKEYIINRSLKIYEDQFAIDQKKFLHFIEEVKNRSNKEQEIIYEIKHQKKEMERTYEDEKIFYKKLIEKLEKRIKEFYILKEYGQFVNNISGNKFLYEGLQEINVRERNFEKLANIIINKYEKEGLNEYPKELENVNLFIRQFRAYEDKIVDEISNKDVIDIENNNCEKKHINKLNQLKSDIKEHEKEIEFLNGEKRKVYAELQNYKIHNDNNLNNYLDHIIDLGKYIGINTLFTKNIDKKYLGDFVSLTKEILDILSDKENTINEKIMEIGDIFDSGSLEDKKILKKIITEQRIFIKKQKQLEFMKKQEALHELERLKIFERSQKVVIKGRKVAYKNKFIKGKGKFKLKNIQIKEGNSSFLFGKTNNDEEKNY